MDMAGLLIWGTAQDAGPKERQKGHVLVHACDLSRLLTLSDV